jgi:DNA replication protein DnaC
MKPQETISDQVAEKQPAEKPQDASNDGHARSRTPKGALRLENPDTAASLSNTTVFHRLQELLHYLGLNTCAANLGLALEAARKQDLSAAQFLEGLLRKEVEVTMARRMKWRARLANLPTSKTLQTFDFDFQPSIDRAVVAELATLRFIEEHRNVILLGPPGVGKSHLATALGLLALNAGFRVRFTTAAAMVNNLQVNYENGTLLKRERQAVTGPPLLIIDELGYLPLDQAAANWIFHVVTRRYERGSIIVTSNRGFADWGQIFNDVVVATAIVDRLIHNATVLNIRGKSYRMRNYLADQRDDRPTTL